MATLVTPDDYPKVRALLGDEEEAVSDLAIEEAALVAEDMIVGRVPTALTETDIALVDRYERAARYLTASILSSQMDGSSNDVSQFKTGDGTISFRQRDWSRYALNLEEIGWSILAAPDDQEADLGYSVFTLSKTARIYRTAN